MTLQYPALLTLAGLSFSVFFGKHQRATQRRLRRINGAAMRVHLALKRYRRDIVPGDDGLAAPDLESVRQLMGWYQRRVWDGALTAYQTARRDALVENAYGEASYRDTSEIARCIDELLRLTAAD